MRDTEDEHTVLRAVTDEIMHTLMTMTGRDYVDRYASEVKKSGAAEHGQEPAVQAAAAGTTAESSRI